MIGRKLAVLAAVTLGLLTLADAGLGADNGAVLQVENSSQLYLVVNGYAAPIPSLKVFDCLGLHKNRKLLVTKRELDAMPKTAFLVRGSDGRVFRVDNEHRRLVPNSRVYHKKGFNQNEEIAVRDRSLRCIPEGPPLH